MESKTRSTFRHGNLKQAATDAACDIVRTEGSDKLSMRRIADEVGVAHRALYNHFTDREAVLDAVAVRGFDELAEHVRESESKSTFISAYLGFALSNALLYDVMMSRPHETMSDNPVLHRAVHRTISLAMTLLGDTVNSYEENRSIVMKATMLMHGGILLRRNGILDVDSDVEVIQMLTSMLNE